MGFLGGLKRGEKVIQQQQVLLLAQQQGVSSIFTNLYVFFVVRDSTILGGRLRKVAIHFCRFLHYEANELGVIISMLYRARMRFIELVCYIRDSEVLAFLPKRCGPNLGEAQLIFCEFGVELLFEDN